MRTSCDHGLHGDLRYWPVPELVALDLPGGIGFVDALQAIWDTGDAAAPLDPRLPPAARQVLLDSPWAKTFTPILTAPQDSGRKPGGIGRELGGVGRDAIGLAIPGIAGRRAPGGDSQGGESPAGQSTGSSSKTFL